MPHFPCARPVVAVVASLGLLAACGGGDDPRPETASLEGERPTVADRTTTTIEGGYHEVPAAPTVTYVDAVMDDLDSLQAEAFLAARRSGALGPEFATVFGSLYPPSGVERYLPRIQQAGLDTVADEPRPPRTQVLELRSASADCIHAITRRDLGPLLRRPYTGGDPHHVKLVRREPDERNPTAWSIDLDTYFLDQSDPGDLCR